MLPRDEAIAKITASIEKTYGRRGAQVVEGERGPSARTILASLASRQNAVVLHLSAQLGTAP